MHAILGVGRDAHDFDRAAAVEAQPASDRILSRPVVADEGLVGDGDPWRDGGVGVADRLARVRYGYR